MQPGWGQGSCYEHGWGGGDGLLVLHGGQVLMQHAQLEGALHVQHIGLGEGEARLPIPCTWQGGGSEKSVAGRREELGCSCCAWQWRPQILPNFIGSCTSGEVK